MHRHTRILPVVLGSALTILLLGCFVSAEAGEEIPAAQTVWQHVGRFYVNPSTGQSVFAGYVVHLNEISASIFNGPPSEATAYFTFSTDVISLTPMSSNGDLSLYLVSAGTFNVYYNANPNANWSDPTTFSGGQLVATFARPESLFPQFTTVGVHPVSETLQSSRRFVFNGQSLNFKHMVPHEITSASYLSTNALKHRAHKLPPRVRGCRHHNSGRGTVGLSANSGALTLMSRQQRIGSKLGHETSADGVVGG